jgi:hypothetical protein
VRFRATASRVVVITGEPSMIITLLLLPFGDKNALKLIAFTVEKTEINFILSIYIFTPEIFNSFHDELWILVIIVQNYFWHSRLKVSFDHRLH